MDLKQIENLIRDIPKTEVEIKDLELLIDEAALNGEVEEVKELQALKHRKEFYIQRIKNALNCLDDNQRGIVDMRFIKNMKYWDIAEDKNKSDRQIKRIVKNALKKINEIIGIR